MKERSLYNNSIKVTFDDSGKRHCYKIEKDIKTGSTTFIGIIDKSASLIPWAVELAIDYVKDNQHLLATTDPSEIFAMAEAQAEQAKEKAADLGSKIHAWVEAYIKGEDPDMPEDSNVLQGVVSFLEWKDENFVEFIDSEKILYSKEHDYVGTMDFTFRIDGKVYVGDLKTGNAIYPEVKLQLASYLKADEEESGTKYEGRWVLRVAKETEQEYYTRMQIKNNKRTARGKKPLAVDPYKVFEAIYLDADENELETDFKGFLNALRLYRWKQQAEKSFKLLKNGK